MSKKNANSAKTLAATIATLAADKTVSLIATRDALNDQLASPEAGDADIQKKLRLDVLNAESRASRSNKVATMSDADAATFALFVTMHDTSEKLATFFARAIYVQDKLRQAISAIARSTSLRSVTRNHSTRVVLAELATSGTSSRKALLAALVRDCGMTANTASSQVSSSLIALQHLGVVTQDSATKDYRIADEALADSLAA